MAVGEALPVNSSHISTCDEPLINHPQFFCWISALLLIYLWPISISFFLFRWWNRKLNLFVKACFPFSLFIFQFELYCSIYASWFISCCFSYSVKMLYQHLTLHLRPKYINGWKPFTFLVKEYLSKVDYYPHICYYTSHDIGTWHMKWKFK